MSVIPVTEQMQFCNALFLVLTSAIIIKDFFSLNAVSFAVISNRWNAFHLPTLHSSADQFLSTKRLARKPARISNKIVYAPKNKY